jgi:hypothetical protein
VANGVDIGGLDINPTDTQRATVAQAMRVVAEADADSKHGRSMAGVKKSWNAGGITRTPPGS